MSLLFITVFWASKIIQRTFLYLPNSLDDDDDYDDDGVWRWDEKRKITMWKYKILFRGLLFTKIGHFRFMSKNKIEQLSSI